MDTLASEQKPLFSNINSNSGNEITEIESLCFKCQHSGMTKLLLTRIPFFREVIISSFKCDHCGEANTSVDSAAPYQDQGKVFTLDVRCNKDLNRRIVQSSHSELIIPSLSSSFPNSVACITTVEGAITTIIENLSFLQPERHKADPKQAALLEDFLEKLRDLLKMKSTFILKLVDPSGNGFIENYQAPLSDPQLSCAKFYRSAAQNEMLGLENKDSVPEKIKEDESSLKESVTSFTVDCPNCHSSCVTNMKIVDIPNFKEVILMAINCSLCGYRDNEVKSVSSIADKGKKHILHIETEEDLSRDLLKSDTASINIADIGLEAETGTLGGRFTTVEGILVAIRDQLQAINPLMFGDSANTEEKQTGIAAICKKIDQIIAGDLKVTLELSDPTGNSYLQSLAQQESESDGRLEVIEFVRTYSQNEELGLNDMKTENYS